MDIAIIKDDLKHISYAYGGRLFGVCRTDDLNPNFHSEMRKISAKLNTAVSVGVPLSGAVLDTLIDRPNILYKTHYRQVNNILNDIAFRISSIIMEAEYNAIAIPASQIISWEPMRAHLSHREIAYKAGLGWRGRNNLLVNDKYGSQVRLVTVLTDLELIADRPTTLDCGDCYACTEACPAGAISEDVEQFDLDACYQRVSEFARPENIGSHICGLCLAPCPGVRK
jgi:epoxyqueuosine reductase QueG